MISTDTTHTSMKAYLVSWKHLPDVGVVIAASKPSKARYSGYLLCADTYREARLIEMQLRRAPEYDNRAADLRDGQRVFQGDGFEPEYVEYWGVPVRVP